tara:strand:- start:389 stop:826 length:438 start_codon:yes stop_codon:yes gene_type:complete
VISINRKNVCADSNGVLNNVFCRMLSGEYFGLTTEHAPREDSKSAFGVPPPRSVAGEISAAALRTTASARAPRRRFPLARRFALERANDVLDFPLKSSSSKTFLFLLFVVKEAREEEEEQKPQPVKVLVYVVVILVSFFLSLSAR